MNEIDIEAQLEKAKKDAATNASKKTVETKALAKAAFATFTSEPGKAVLEYFKKFTVDSRTPICDPRLPPEKAANTGFFRSGQNAVIHEIMDLIERGEKGE